MQEVLLKVVMLIHVLFVLFVVITPFTNSNYLLLLHSIIIPFIILHWITNNDTCALTTAERYLRQNISKEAYDDSQCFTCRLIEPVYNFVDDNKTFSKIIYIVTISLWLISVGKLAYKYKTGSINSLTSLFIL